MAVTYTLNGTTYAVDDLTIDEAAAIEIELGITWEVMNPAKSAVQARAILTRFLARDKGDEEGLRIIGAMTMAQFVKLVKIEDTDPKDEASETEPIAEEPPA